MSVKLSTEGAIHRILLGARVVSVLGVDAGPKSVKRAFSAAYASSTRDLGRLPQAAMSARHWRY
jgi:hypothetical protein